MTQDQAVRHFGTSGIRHGFTRTAFLVNCLLAGVSAAALAQQPKQPPPPPHPTTPAAAPAPAAVVAAPTAAPVASPPPPAAARPVPAPVAPPAPAVTGGPATTPPTGRAAAGAPAAAKPNAGTAALPPAAAAATARPATASATAVAPAPVPLPAATPPKPAPELDQMKVLEGSWRCDGRAPAGPSGPEHAYKSTWKFKRDLDNFWLAAEYQQTKNKTNPMPMKARGYLTYDPAAKAFVLVGVDNTGGSSTESTSGWSGDVVTLAGDASMAGRKVQYREIITKKGTREFTWRGEMKTGGDWVTLGEDRCKK